ncbi:MAG TPA: NAD(P)/FAD-dependent oxidoreductase [Polyangiaceae bacterium]|nr:NAD(P)/FAD-dependent oxidoreductase [Polyangiaceae bacterium]
MKSLDIGVVGAGFAGTAASLFLAERGHRVRLYEEAERPAPVGAGILMQPTGLSVLADLGLLRGALERGSRIDALVCKTPTGRAVLDLAYRDLEAGWFGLGMHRGALFELLHSQLGARGVELVTGASVRASRLTTRGIRPILADGGEPGEHELLVVADGARSALRRAVPGAAATPYPWGALWFVARDPRGVFPAALEQVADGTTTLLGFLPCGLGPRSASEVPLVSLFWSVPVRDLSKPLDLPRWKERVLSLDARAEEVLSQIEDAAQLLPASYFDVHLPRFDAPRMAFIGDAAHATSPQLGQGTNLALEDARVLAACVSASRDLPSCLARFSRARRAHVRFYQRASWGLTPFFQSDWQGLSVLRDLAMGSLCSFGPSRRLMLQTLAGVRSGFMVGRLPVGPIRARLSRNQP